MKLDLEVLTSSEKLTLGHTMELSTKLIDICANFISEVLPPNEDLHDWSIQARHVLMRVVPPEDHSAATEDRVRTIGMALLLLESVLNLDRHTPDLHVVTDD